MNRDEFVKAWRKAHPNDVQPVAWECPLCRLSIQGIDLGQQSRAIKVHADNHGTDWTALAETRPVSPRHGV